MVQPQRRSAVAQIRREKEQLRKRIEHDPQLKKDFEFLINKTGLTSRQLLTGLWLDCNMMKADRQTLLNKAKQEIWTISEDSLRRTIKRIGRVAREVAAADRTNFLPLGTEKLGDNFADLPEMLHAYSIELQRRVDVWASHWQGKRARIPGLVFSTRQNSVYERIRSSAGSYHQTRLLRLLNVARDLKGYPRVPKPAFTTWLNRLKKKRQQHQSKLA